MNAVVKNKVGRNLLWLIWSGTVSVANSVLLWIFIARMRDVEELGRFTVVMGLYALFFNVCSLGLMPKLVTEVSRRDETGSPAKDTGKIIAFVSSAAVLLSISGFICAGLMTAVGLAVSQSWSVRVSTLILSLALIPTGLICVAESTAVALGRTRLIAFASTFENVLRTVVPLVLLWFGCDITVICVSLTAVRFAALFVYLWTARGRLAHFAFNKLDFFKLARISPTFGGTIILASVNWQAVIILLGVFSTEIESAKYGIASRFLIPVSILMGSYANVIQPVVTQHARKSLADAGRYLSKMVAYPLVLATFAAIVSPFLSRQVLTVFFGANYADASAALDILAMSVVPFCVVMVVSRGLIAANSQRIDLLANAVGVIVCVTAATILIPRFGAVGAAIAQTLSFLAIALTESLYLSKKIIGFRIWRKACLSSAFLTAIYLILWKL